MMWQINGYTEDARCLDWHKIQSEYSWIRDMKDVPQDPIHHAEGDVQIHTRMVVQELLNLPEFLNLHSQNKSILFAAALLHDVEKRSTTKEEEGRIISPGHAKRGEYTARSILYKDLKAPFYIREQVCKLVRHHGLPIWFDDKSDPIHSLISASQEVSMENLHILSKADMLGRICADQDEMIYRVDFFKEMCIVNECYNTERIFPNSLARFKYLSEAGYIDYVPFDDTKFRVIMMVGLPGSGKDTIIKKHYSDLPIVSLDDIRRSKKIDPTDKKGNGQVVQEGKERARELMRKKQSFVWNATNITKDMRQQLISLFLSYGARVDIAYVESPYDVMMKQNMEREHQVPSSVIDRLLNKLEVPIVSECHEVIYHINE